MDIKASDYTHDFADCTASALEDFAHNILTIGSMSRGNIKSLHISYEDASGQDNELMIYCRLDDNGTYYFNEYAVGDLRGAIEVYSLGCAPIFKKVSVDEAGADALENVTKAFSDNPLNDLEDRDSLNSGINVSCDDMENEGASCSIIRDLSALDTEGDEDEELYEEFPALHKLQAASPIGEEQNVNMGASAL